MKRFYINSLFALYLQVKIVYLLMRNNYDYEKTVKDIYNELERYL